jgi:hypothetical protein
MTSQSLTPPKLRRLIAQLVIGALVGGVTSFLAFTNLKHAGIDIDDPSRVLALGVGLVFAIMGLFVGLGVAAPSAGSKLLNVEDSEELHEQGAQLKYGALIYLLAGVALLVLGMGAPIGQSGLIQPEIAGAIAGLCFLAGAWASYSSRKLTDEMMLQVGREASTLALYLAIILAAGWAVVAQFRPVAVLSPLSLLAGLLGLSLVSVMIVAARRGLLRPR